jgi:hypothetical protein
VSCPHAAEILLQVFDPQVSPVAFINPAVTAVPSLITHPLERFPATLLRLLRSAKLFLEGIDYSVIYGK